MKYCILYIFSFLSIFSFAQNAKIDSLIDQIPNKNTDTAKVNLLNRICFEFLGVNNSSALEYGNLAKELGEKINFSKGLGLTHYNFGSVYKDMGDYNNSLKHYLQSFEIREKIGDEKEIAASLINIGIVFKELNSFEKSLEYFNKASAIAEKNRDINNLATVENGIGSLYWKFKNHDQSLIHYIKALDLRESLGVKKDIASSLNNLGLVNKDYSNFVLALEYHKKALNIYKQISDRKAAAYTLTLLGNTYKEMKMYSEAVEYYIEALKMREEIGNKKDIASSYNNVGDIYKSIYNYTKSLEYLEKALALRIELKDENLIAYTKNDIGSIYWKLKKHDVALVYYHEALALRRGAGDKLGTASSLKNIGIIYKELKNYDTALDNYTKAMNIFEEIGDKKNLVNVLNYMGNVFVEQKNFEKAREYYFQSYAISNEAVFKEGIASSASNIGELLAKTGKLPESIKYFDHALSVAREINQKEIVVKIYDMLDDLYAGLSDFNKAWQYHKLYAIAKDSLMAEEGSKKVAETEVKYLTFKQDKEMLESKIELLEKESQLGKEVMIKYILLAISIVILIFLFLLYNQFQIKKRSNELLKKQKHEIEEQSKLIEFAHKELQIYTEKITDSIAYAKLIQDAILPSANKIKHYLPDSFIFFRPKDNVSGDFYWIYQEGKKTFFAEVDCTGHGVPGGFMSMIGYTLLNEIVKEKKTFDLSRVLEKLNAGVLHTLNQSESKQDDGMDLSICCIDRETNKLSIALANQTALLVQDNEMNVIKGDIYSIGGIFSLRGKIEFTTHEFDLKKDTVLYMFSDGLPDQMGEESNKKFSTAQLEKLLMTNHALPMTEQKDKLASAFSHWMGCKRQIDDVLVTGIRINCV